jgi:hypothetical protein
MLIIIWLIKIFVSFSVIDCKIVYAVMGRQIKLHCGCGQEQIRSRLWYEGGTLLYVPEFTEDDWDPELQGRNETLILQIQKRNMYYYRNTTYDCIAVLVNGTKALCGSYTVIGFCKSVTPKSVFTLQFIRIRYRLMHNKSCRRSFM